MQKRTMVLALVGVLVMATASHAAICLEFIYQGALPEKVPGKQLDSWLLRAVSDEGVINAVTSPMLYGGTVERDSVTYVSSGKVHQCYPMTALKTPYFYQINEGVNEPDDPWGTLYGWTDEHTAADTHLLLWPNSYALRFEGVNRLKENFVSAIEFNAFGFFASGTDGTIKSGMSTWSKQITDAEYDTTITVLDDLAANPPIVRSSEVLDIAQIVVERGTTVFFSGRVGGPDVAPVQFTDVVCPIYVPEPSAVAMLVLGGLCLVGHRCWRRVVRRG